MDIDNKPIIILIVGFLLIAIGGSMSMAKTFGAESDEGYVRLLKYTVPNTVSQGEEFSFDFKIYPHNKGWHTVEITGSGWSNNTKSINVTNDYSLQKYSMSVKAPTQTGTHTLEVEVYKSSNPSLSLSPDSKSVNIVSGDVESHTLYFKYGGSGTGQVAITPAGEYIGRSDGYIMTKYLEQTDVTLEPSSSSYTIDHWAGDIYSTNQSVTVTMDSDKTVEAYFETNGTNGDDGDDGNGGTEPTYYTISGEVVQGSGDISGTGQYQAGEEVTLKANPDEGYVFEEWGGDIGGSSKTTTITVDSDMSITASFKRKETYTLTIDKNPSDGGTLSLTQSKQITVSEPKNVSIQAFPNEGYVFDKWSGVVGTDSKTLTIYLDEDKSITANFVEEEGMLGTLSNNINYILIIVGAIMVSIGSFWMVSRQ